MDMHTCLVVSLFLLVYSNILGVKFTLGRKNFVY